MEQKSKQWLMPVIISSALVVLIIDYFTPVGYADFILYFIPIILTSLNHDPRLPTHVALATSILSLLGFILSPESDVKTQVAIMNRSYAMFTIWVVAFLVRQNITTRNRTTQNTWLRYCLNDLAERIRGELTTLDMGTKALNFFAETLKLNVGKLFLRLEGSSEFELVAGHAVAPGDTVRKVRPGEGITGQCIADNKMLQLQNIPPDYLKVHSTLGERSPTHITILPLHADGAVTGVLELAFLDPLADFETELLSLAAEPLAIALRSSRHKAMLTALLQDAQQTAEELQAQQEELRVTNEELEQQSSALKETHVKLENQQAELEQTNQQLEEQAQTLERQKSVLDERNFELLRAQEVLKEKAQELQRSSQYKSEFLANMSHELRTPLNSTMILARLLADNKPGNLTAEQIKFAQIIETSGTDLLNLINDILDLSKVEAGKMVINPELIRLDQIAQTMDHSFTHLAMEKKLKFTIRSSPSAPVQLISDKQRVEQVLKNLLSNAFKFTEQGEVTLEIRPEASGLAFSVSDTGLGISPQKQQAIFEAFTQADGTTNRKFGGTGLGLSISKEFARILGGRISLTSTEGKGSTFTLHLPLEFKAQTEPDSKIELRTPSPKLPEAPTSETAPRPLKPTVRFGFDDDRTKISGYTRRMLIIEDDETFAKVLFDLSREQNFGVLVAPNAEEGLRLATEHVPHAILLDVGLPDHSGMVVLDQLKLNPRTRHIPVHMISGEDFAKSALEMGAMGYLRKPVKKEDLARAFGNLGTMLEQKMKKVLVLEDDKVQRDHIVQLISDPSIEVDAVETSRAALEKLASKTYDCMIMDLSLPDMSGYELLSQLKDGDSVYSFPPVIVYTARDLTREEEEKLRLHSGSIIVKGAKSPERLLSEVTLFLHRVETELPPDRQKMLTDLRNREQSLADKTILVVDDDVRNIFALTSSLESSGSKIVVARNGVEALKKLETVPGIDLVLMDIMMPEMDGYEAMRRIRANKALKGLPVIALTAKAMSDDKQKCLDAGANDYLSKPINMDKLLSLIRVWLPSKRSFKL